MNGQWRVYQETNGGGHRDRETTTKVRSVRPNKQSVTASNGRRMTRCQMYSAHSGHRMGHHCSVAQLRTVNVE